MKENLEKLKEMLKVQGVDGNWNYDPYMHGMYNGIVFSIALLEDKEPKYRDAPKEWLLNKIGCDKPTYHN